MNTISTFDSPRIAPRHLRIRINAFPNNGGTAAVQLYRAIITRGNNSRLYSLYTQIACANKTRFSRTGLFSFYDLYYGTYARLHRTARQIVRYSTSRYSHPRDMIIPPPVVSPKRRGKKNSRTIFHNSSTIEADALFNPPVIRCEL